MTRDGKDEYYLDPKVAERYARERHGLDGDVPFYAALAREAAADGRPSLELGCGTGRVTIPIARQGLRVVGLDRSPAMLAVARRDSAGLDNARWVEGDMAEFDLGEQFGLVFIPARSFLLLLTVDEQKSCLRAAHRHLAPGGRLALNIFNPNIVAMGQWLSVKRGSLEKYAAGLGDERSQQWATRELHTATQQVDETQLTDATDDRNVVVSRVYRKMRVRYVFRYEMEHLLALCGFAIEGLYGWFDRRPFTDESTEMVWVARRLDTGP